MNDTGAVEVQTAEKAPVKPRSRLVRKYALLISVLVSGVLIVSGAVETYFSYQETKLALLRIQREKAASAAAVIGRFIEEMEAQIGWTMHASALAPDSAMAQRRLDFLRLLRQTPAISEIAYVDGSGQEQLLVSRLEIDVVGSGKYYGEDPKFYRARTDGRYFSPVYFRSESEPYLSLGLRGHGRDKGVTIAEVNLKFVWDVISRIGVGRGGSAFVVDSNGLLVAYRDISLVLRKTDLSTLPQVASARVGSLASENGAVGGIAEGLEGHEVLSSHAAITPLGWLVFVESPLREAFAPLYDSLLRTGILIAAGLTLSIVAGLLLARRIVEPIQALQHGASRIAAGELDHHIDISTGDEIEVLADEFNEMTEKLRQSYNNVERMSALKRYFSPHLADLIVSSDNGKLTESHRREITVVFCDLRNFTEFSSVAEPEEAMRVLEQYYNVLGRELRRFEATIGHFAGDGLMAFFNDPLSCPDHAVRAVRMAVAMQDHLGNLIEQWAKRGLDLGFGVGIASGYATLGHIGTEDQFHYTAIGSVVNLSSRLCDEAESGEILIAEAVYAEAEALVEVKPGGEYSLKGFPKPVRAVRVVGLRRENC
ncbi:MAG: HAMP domain-containing protein [Verrucomicrobiales bacterium]|nr:HAMP domain-containing protein [Verrucomicrobiales bacterium]